MKGLVVGGVFGAKVWCLVVCLGSKSGVLWCVWGKVWCHVVCLGSKSGVRWCVWGQSLVLGGVFGAKVWC